MKEKTKNIVVTIIFIVLLFSISLTNILYRAIKKDNDVSVSERRKLQQFPKITIDNIMNGNFSNNLENYAMDQFILRDEIRSIKTFVKLDILRQKNNNNLFTMDNVIYKMNYPLNENSVLNITNKINNIYEKYLKGMNVSYTIVPDKNYFLPECSSYLKIDYNKLKNIMNNNINSNIKYIDIFDTLNINSYYNTDTHWKQEKILDSFDKICTELNIKDRINTEFIPKDYDEFFGAYYGQLGKKMVSDRIEYLTNDIIDNATTYNYENKKEAKIYDIDKASISLDKYDLFVSGATPIIEIRNDNCNSDCELIIFRDSFGSSIAPLFTEAYKKITLVDTRYITSDMLEQYINFNNQDVLFLYSTLIINDSGALK